MRVYLRPKFVPIINEDMVAFEEIPQRELRGLRIVSRIVAVTQMLHSKKSHKGNWESTPSWSTAYLGVLNTVAFEEIPQRELRDQYYLPRRGPRGMLRLHSKKSHKGNWEQRYAVPEHPQGVLDDVAFEEIPQRELREQLKSNHITEYVRWKSCIRRNPTKGIERWC